jgi:hypothetical protein
MDLDLTVDLLEPGIRLLHGFLRRRLCVVDEWTGRHVDYEFLNQGGVDRLQRTHLRPLLS